MDHTEVFDRTKASETEGMQHRERRTMPYMPSAIYNLWYREGIEAHDIQQVQRIRTKANVALKMIEQSDSQREAERVAERLLHDLHFDTETYKSARIHLGRHSVKTDSILSKEIENVHRACSDAIRSKWHRPMMNDKELADYFFEREIEPEIKSSFAGKSEPYIIRATV